MSDFSLVIISPLPRLPPLSTLIMPRSESLPLLPRIRLIGIRPPCGQGDLDPFVPDSFYVPPKTVSIPFLSCPSS